MVCSFVLIDDGVGRSLLASHEFLVFFIPFVHKSLQNYNDFVWTVTRLNRDMNNS